MYYFTNAQNLSCSLNKPVLESIVVSATLVSVVLWIRVVRLVTVVILVLKLVVSAEEESVRVNSAVLDEKTDGSVDRDVVDKESDVSV